MTHLIIAVVDARHGSARETGNGAHGATDTAADIEDGGFLSELQLGREEVLRATERFLVRFADETVSEVERVTPSILVEIRHEGVERIHHRHVVRLALVEQRIVITAFLARLSAEVVLHTEHLKEKE